MSSGNEREGRVIILTPVGRDAALVSGTLAAVGIKTFIVPCCGDLIQEMDLGAAAVVVTEEALPPQELEVLANWVARQPDWSDLPFLVLTSAGRPTAANRRQAEAFLPLGNQTLIERPVRPETIQSAVSAALRSRSRQYQTRRRQETLVRVNADLEHFAYSASHDLREPLRNVNIFSELLERKYAGLLSEEGRHFVDVIRSSTNHMELLVNDLFAYTQAASIEEESAESISAEAAMDIALANLSQPIAESGAQVTRGELPLVQMNATHLEQLFQNLVGNAIKYRGSSSPMIHVNALASEADWQFSVSDNGIGIATEYHERVFGIFKRLHTKDQYPGTGIGLAICKRIVERYGGRIWVESSPGDGATFSFTVPRSKIL